MTALMTYGPRISNAHLLAIGRITVEFATLEYSLSAMVSMFISRKYIGRMVAAQLSFKRQVDLIGSIAGLRFTGENAWLKKDIDNLLIRSLKAEEKRNTVVHSSWLAHVGNPELITAREDHSDEDKRSTPETRNIYSPRLECYR